MAAGEHAESGPRIAHIGKIEEAVDDWNLAMQRHGSIDDHLA